MSSFSFFTQDLDASNVGASGVGAFKQKSGDVLQFRKIAVGPGLRVQLTEDTLTIRPNWERWVCPAVEGTNAESGPQNVVCQGAMAGDRIAAIWRLDGQTNNQKENGNFESIISQDGFIVQLNEDLVGMRFALLLLRDEPT